MSSNQGVIYPELAKNLFIYMFVRDILLIRAIIDLVNNSIDGATRLQNCNNYENKSFG